MSKVTKKEFESMMNSTKESEANFLEQTKNRKTFEQLRDERSQKYSETDFGAVCTHCESHFQDEETEAIRKDDFIFGADWTRLNLHLIPAHELLRHPDVKALVEASTITAYIAAREIFSARGPLREALTPFKTKQEEK